MFILNTRIVLKIQTGLSGVEYLPYKNKTYHDVCTVKPVLYDLPGEQ
jgi:hypothetical protein